MEVAPLSPNQRYILEAVVSGRFGIFPRSNLSKLVTSMWERRTFAKRVKAYVQPLSLISLFAQRIEKPNQQKLETGFEKAWLSPLSYEM